MNGEIIGIKTLNEISKLNKIEKIIINLMENNMIDQKAGQEILNIIRKG